jgi:hypothetical protein
MRTVLLALAALAAAGPAAAQLPSTVQDQILRNELAAQQRLEQQRQVAIDNQLMALEAQARASQGIAASQAQSARPYIPLPSAGPSVSGGRAEAAVDTSKLASIPDDRLAASNAAVRAVTQPRH